MSPPLAQCALEIDGVSIEASRELAIAWIECGKFEKATVPLASLAEHRAEPEIHQFLGRANKGSGMSQQPAEEYRIAESEEPSKESLFGEGYELVLAGRLAEAAIIFENGVQKHPKSIPLRIGAGAGAASTWKILRGSLKFPGGDRC